MFTISSSFRGRVLAAAVSGAVLAGAGGALAASPAAATDTTATFGFTGGLQSWTVPAGVDSATFTLNGAQGGQGGGLGAHSPGGKGGQLVAAVPVTAGDTYAIVVGGRGADALRGGLGGAGGFNGGALGGPGPVLTGNTSGGGGGGGGATDIRHGGTGIADRLLVAGGGGGSSGANSWPFSGTGGFVQAPSSVGGAGGAFEDDATAGASDPTGGDGGGPGTSVAGGHGAAAHGFGGPQWNGQDGAAGAGGAGGGDLHPGGGGGGGGWFGGGGGANGTNPSTSSDAGYQGAGGGGGGGSGHADPAEITDIAWSAGAHEGNGSVTISFVVDTPPEPVPPSIGGTPPDGIVGSPYSFPFVLDAAVVSCFVSLGTLPPGIDLDGDACTLAGTPTAGGTYPFIIGASNGGGGSAYANVSVTVTAPTPPSLPAGIELTGTVGQPFSYRLPVTGEPAPTVALVEPDGLPAGVTLDPDGLVHGTPTQIDAKFGVNVHLTSSAGETYGSFRFFVGGTPAAFTSGVPTDLTYGQPYSFGFTATGFPAAVFRVASGRLPNGLSLDRETGILSGSSTELGEFPVVIGAQSWGDEVQQSYTLRVTGSAPRINDTPPAASVNTNYSFTFDTAGSNPAPSFTRVSGTLPAGLTLYSNGVISGYPTRITPGSPVTVTASNGAGPDAELTFTLPVNAIPQGISGTPPTAVAVGADYYFGYRLTGTPAPTTSVTQGVLPTGLTLSDNGYLTGRPTTPGTYTFTVTAAGGAGPTATVTSTVVVQSPPVTISGTPPEGGVGEPYSFAFATSGGPTVTLSRGSLPPGLGLSSAGRLSGTPTEAGTFDLAVRAVHGTGSAERTVRLVIRPLPMLSICDGAVAEGNSGTRVLTLRVSLSRASSVPVTVRWATANGTATAGSDYTAAAGTVTFAAGQTSKSVTVQVRGDRTRERTEAFVVRLTAATHAATAKATGIGGIVNDD